MQLGEVIGKVVATLKDPSLQGIPLLVIQPIDENRKVSGLPLVAIDVVSAGHGETIYWVGAREAPNALPTGFGPADAAIVGIADQVTVGGG